MNNFFIITIIITLLSGFITDCDAQNKKPFSQLGFDQGPSDNSKPRPTPVDQVNEILKAFSKTSEPSKPKEGLDGPALEPVPTATPTLPPAKRRRSLSQID